MGESLRIKRAENGFFRRTNGMDFRPGVGRPSRDGAEAGGGERCDATDRMGAESGWRLRLT
ncbi:MAG: hypothetical protein LBO05_02615, partial [Deltaproteobacteria bacterium]|nr:hypothetical protein [Deltaproteobacteria bacterium]